MLLSADQVSALLNTLGLTQSLFKPLPDLIGGLTAPLDGVVSAVDGIAGGLGLPTLTSLPIIGSLLDAKDAEAVNDVYSSLALTSDQISASDSCDVAPYDPAPVLSQTFPPFDRSKANIFRYRKQQSVNLGSWFVHEQWMTPSVFTCASDPQTAEIDIATGWGNTTGAQAVLERHWDTFINQSDFEYLSSIGINTVRLPIGYWSLGPVYCQGTSFEPVADVYTNSWSRVVRAINWAGEAGIGVLIDLHGAPGSQNGQPHSGISDGKVNFFNNATNQDLTINALTFLTQQLASVTNVIGIEILNEPNNDPSLPAFYDRAIKTMRQVSPAAANLPLYIHDAFNLAQYSAYVSRRTDFVVEDHHSYFVFDSTDESQTAQQDIQDVDTNVAQQLKNASHTGRGNVIIGEWSCALVPASLGHVKNQLVARQQFCQGQEQVYTNTTAGWHFWSYMLEDCKTDLDWCFKNAVGNTLPSQFFSYNSTPATSPFQAAYIARSLAEMQLPSMTEVLEQANGQSSDSSSSSASDESSTTTSDDSVNPTPSVSSKRSTNGHRQRFFDIHSRRAFLSDVVRHKRSSVLPTPLANLTGTERSIAKGYSDGFLTAKIFAQYGMSRLGFRDQYKYDSIQELGPTVIAPGTEDYYDLWFDRGLKDAEGLISEASTI